jgi:2-C-methyl-D-erythritol 4-phosphate cytidylyltransferase
MTVALIVAAGRGHRLGGPIPKQYRILDGIPIIRHTVSAFRRHPGIEAIQVVINALDHELYAEATQGLDLPPPLIGGSARQESVRLGLEGITGRTPDKVIIHDAVRPFVAQEMISAVIAALDRVAGAIAGVQVSDTLKRCKDHRILSTVERADLWRAQTPQGFRYRDILAAHRQVYPLEQEFTDDSMVAEQAGLPIEMIPGTDDNFKITTEADLIRAEIMLRRSRETHAG